TVRANDLPILSAEFMEASCQLLGGQETPVPVDVGQRRRTDGAGDVTGDGIDGLVLPSEAVGGASIEQEMPGGIPRGACGVQEAAHTHAGCGEVASSRGDRARLSGLTGCGPGGDTAVQDTNTQEAEVSQHPPEPAGRQ